MKNETLLCLRLIQQLHLNLFLWRHAEIKVLTDENLRSLSLASLLNRKPSERLRDTAWAF